MSLMAIGAGLGMVNSALQTGLGLAQLIKGGRMNPQRPTYEIPDEVGAQLGLRQQLLNARMAGARGMERNLQESAATGMYNATQGAASSEDLLAAGAMSQGNTNRSLRDLQIREAQDYESRVQGLERAQMNMAGYKDKEFQMNEMDPYMEAAATKSALTSGGLQNLSGGLASASAQFGKMYEADEMTGEFSGLFKAIKDRIGQRALERRIRSAKGAPVIDPYFNSQNPYG